MEEAPPKVKAPLEELLDFILELDREASLKCEQRRRLEWIYRDLEARYVQVTPMPGQVWDVEVPTPAQGLALARFLRPHFRDPSHASAFVTRGGAGLGNNYLHVRFNDGYEGGIDREGKVST